MGNEKNNKKRNRRQEVYVKPILTFAQVVEIINECIDNIEKKTKTIKS